MCSYCHQRYATHKKTQGVVYKNHNPTYGVGVAYAYMQVAQVEAWIQDL